MQARSSAPSSGSLPPVLAGLAGLTPVITVNSAEVSGTDREDLGHTQPHHGDDDGQDDGASDCSEGSRGSAGAAGVRDIGQSKQADLARRSIRVRGRVAEHRQQRRRLQQEQEEQVAKSKQIERLRRDKDILTNFMRMRLEETQSSFSSSEVASSSGLEPSSDSELLNPSGEATASRHGLSSGMSSRGAGGSSARSRRRDDIRKILRQRRRRRRLMLMRCGEDRVEQYTDKTRNAAVLMGEKDIKLSLKQQRRAMAAARGFSLPASAQPSGLTALARKHRRAGQPRAALQLLEQALLLDPMNRAALLERSQCYQLLGQPRLALLDAEDALDLDKSNDSALLHKAQSLYSMGHFEKALLMFHRGRRLRPENPAFKLGIQRAREAIVNIIGCLPRDFTLSSCDRLQLDEDSSMGSARRASEMALLSCCTSRRSSIRTSHSVLTLALPWTDDGWAAAEESPDTTAVSQLQVPGLCESCNTAHEVRALPATTKSPPQAPPMDVAEQEALQIAFILSVSNAHDGRNKHLRDSLLLMDSTPTSNGRERGRTLGLSRQASVRHSPGEPSNPCRCRPQPRPPVQLHQQLPSPKLPAPAPGPSLPGADTRHAKHAVKVGSKVTRPGVERVPPSLGRDAAFLQKIAQNPRLQGLPVSGLAEEAVRFLRNRQVFWQRRGLTNRAPAL